MSVGRGWKTLRGKGRLSMKEKIIIAWSMLFVLNSLSLGLLSAEEQDPPQNNGDEQRSVPLSVAQASVAWDWHLDPPSQEQTTASSQFTYQRRSNASALAGILVANTPRGPLSCVTPGEQHPGSLAPTLAVLAPADHVGFTGQASPSLYWYLSQLTPCQIRLNLTEEHSGTTLLDAPLAPPTNPGVQRILLAPHNVVLQPGVRYRWSVSLIRDPKDRLKDLTASGGIERTKPIAAVQQKLPLTTRDERPALYAEAGLWYDAVMAIGELLEKNTEDLITARALPSLLLAQGGWWN